LQNTQNTNKTQCNLVALSRLVTRYRRQTTYVFRSRGRFGNFCWPHGHAAQWVQRPAWVCTLLLVAYSIVTIALKTHRFWARATGQTNRQADRLWFRLMPPLWRWRH